MAADHHSEHAKTLPIMLHFIHATILSEELRSTSNHLCFTVTLQVKGQRIDVNSKIRTRARAKEQAEQWQMVPLPAKLIALLADSVSESAGAKLLECAALHHMPWCIVP